jgi:hypothetical protein
VMRQLVAEARKHRRRRIRIRQLRLLHEQNVRLGALEPPRDLVEAGLERVDVPGGDAHAAHILLTKPRARPVGCSGTSHPRRSRCSDRTSAC